MKTRTKVLAILQEAHDYCTNYIEHFEKPKDENENVEYDFSAFETIFAPLQSTVLHYFDVHFNNAKAALEAALEEIVCHEARVSAIFEKTTMRRKLLQSGPVGYLNICDIFYSWSDFNNIKEAMVQTFVYETPKEESEKSGTKSGSGSSSTGPQKKILTDCTKIKQLTNIVQSREAPEIANIKALGAWSQNSQQKYYNLGKYGNLGPLKFILDNEDVYQVLWEARGYEQLAYYGIKPQGFNLLDKETKVDWFFFDPKKTLKSKNGLDLELYSGDIIHLKKITMGSFQTVKFKDSDSEELFEKLKFDGRSLKELKVPREEAARYKLSQEQKKELIQ